MKFSKYRHITTYLYHDSTNPIEFSNDKHLCKAVLSAIATIFAQSACFAGLQPATNLLTNDPVEYSLVNAGQDFSLLTFYSYGVTFLVCSIFPYLVSREQESTHTRATGYRALAYMLTLGGLGTTFFSQQTNNTDSLNHTLVHYTLPLVLAACCVNIISKSFCLHQLDADEKNAPLLG
jgi:hypothetical protein